MVGCLGGDSLAYKSANSEAQKNRDAWLERRKLGIGATDSPSILGVSEWGSALSVFNEKTGRESNFEMTERMEIGLEIEDFIAHLFQKRMGKKIRRKSNEIYSKDHDFIFATIDRDICHEKSILECKNVGIFDKDRWDGRVPENYFIQCHHQMYVTGSTRVYLAALFSGNQFEVYEIDRDQEVIDWMIPRLTSFWKDNVVAGIPPIANRLDTGFLNREYFGHNGEIVDVSDESREDLVNEYFMLKEIIYKSTSRKDDISNELKQSIGFNKAILTRSFHIGWSRWNTPKLDVEGLKKDHPELCLKYMADSIGGRINITNKKENSIG